jgi:NADH:ubiquinone oxidoreductase subunit 5 (subunit L)/multisubunit Na+/H+ antiporter MnhA subunit
VYGLLRIAITKFPGPTHDVRVPILVFAAIGLVYGSLVAFRAPDVRGVVAYSSLAQMGLIVLGLFAANSLGFDGAILQSVNHGLLSATLFLLAGGIERRTATGELSRLGGMARGRPALATVLMTTGIIALAVPGSSAFAGEFLILAGVFQQGWAWAVIGAVAIVLAAMYMLRLISAVLHQDVGSAVPDAALDLRPGELAVEATFPWPGPGLGSAFVEVARRHGDFALVAAGALLALSPGRTVGEARVVLSGVGATPFRATTAERALQGQPATEETIGVAATVAGDGLQPADDIHAPAAYRRRVAQALVKRALLRALERANGDGRR